ncbi:LOB domain-containing protein 37-like [Cornus florida]|uniref:LOB domain-containing protein 37-like n=1 Tax=Cornus florida TaxID=4283 RepID=UPI0028A28375|nr:LOB domain-containing protein 37-like [Cornus florida]
MSCNGCRVLRKGCTENCILRQCLQGIESSQAQANATVFVAKFFGRAGLMSFISAVPDSQRPALFQSLLFEACGRTVNPVSGAVGLLWTGNWHVCQAAVETVLGGGTLHPMPEFLVGASVTEYKDASEANDVELCRSQEDLNSRSKAYDRKDFEDVVVRSQPNDLNLRLTQSFGARMTAGGRVNRRTEKRRRATLSLNSEESETTTLESASAFHQSLLGGGETKLLRLFL